MAEPMLIARGEVDCFLLPGMANRHGVVTGATGTGKTVTIQAISEHFSDIGVPVFVSDVKGDVAGLAMPGGGNERVDARLVELNMPQHEWTGYPVVFWDVFGELGHPARATVSDMGPLLMSRLLNLNDTQTGVMQITFAYADARGLLLIDLKDLRATLHEVNENRKELSVEYGAVSPASVAAIQRELLRLEQSGGNDFFGEPSLQISDLMLRTMDGRGVINILAAEKLFHDPIGYATFLLWLLSELYETMPEIGDPEQPVMVFFFDEAHMLFNEAPKSLQTRIEQVIRLIRSKGIGIYFVTQMPIDIPDTVLGQLGNKVQHALRAYTPRDLRAVQAVADTFRSNPDIDVANVVIELEVGEALISFLDEKGAPGIVQRAKVIPPRSRIGTLTPEERQQVIAASPVGSKYDMVQDRETAYETLAVGNEQEAAATAAATEEKARAKEKASSSSRRREKSTADKVGDIFVDVADSASREIGRSLVRGLLGSLKK